MLLSIIVYSSLALTLFALGWHVSQREAKLKAATGQTLPFWSWEIILSIVIFATVAGARYHTGYDHMMYLRQYIFFQKFGFFTRDFEPLFMWVTQLLAGLHLHFFFYFALWASLEITVLYYAFNDYKHLIPWIGLLIVLGPVFIHLMNTMRQGVVECSLPLLVVLCYRKKIVQALVLIILLTTLHRAAAFLIILVFLRPQAIKGKRLMWISLFLLTFIAGQFPVWMPYLNKAILSLPFDDLLSYFREIPAVKERTSAHINTIGPLTIIIFLSQMIVLYFAKEAGAKVEHSFIGFPLVFYSAVFYILGSNFFASAPVFFMRPFELFMMAYWVLLASVIYYLFKTRQRCFALILTGINVSYVYLAILKVVINPTPINSVILYNTYLQL